MLRSSRVSVSDLPLLNLTPLPSLTRARVCKSWYCRPLLPLPTPRVAHTRMQKQGKLQRESIVVEGQERTPGQMHRPSLSTGVAKKPVQCLLLQGRAEDGA